MGKIYTLDGEIIDTDETFHGTPFFRKMSINKNELEICKILMNSLPHENIVKIYHMRDTTRILEINSYYDMELLDTNLQAFSLDQIKQTMIPVKDYLQSLGILYIDWKPDNIGIGLDGKLKLFDFDGSGLMEKDTDQWKPGYKSRQLWAYNKAIEAGAVTPKEIDNSAFDIGFEPENHD